MAARDELGSGPLCGGSGALCALLRRATSLLPRRVAEPTGPLDVLVDLVLGLVVARGASRAQLAALPVAVVSCMDPAADRCAICLAPFELGERARVLDCSHRFHVEVRLCRARAAIARLLTYLSFLAL